VGRFSGSWRRRPCGRRRGELGSGRYKPHMTRPACIYRIPTRPAARSAAPRTALNGRQFLSVSAARA